jgi:hypothetical protein
MADVDHDVEATLVIEDTGILSLPTDTTVSPPTV